MVGCRENTGGGLKVENGLTSQIEDQRENIQAGDVVI